MKMIKYVFLIVPFFFMALGCDMAPTERTGIVELSISGPGTLGLTSSISSRIIPMDTQSIVIITYPSYNDGITNDIAAFPNVDTLLNDSKTKKYILNPSISKSAYLTDLEPGEWSFLIFSYYYEMTMDSLTNTDSLGVNNCRSYLIKKNVEIQGGYNFLDAPLGLNLDSSYHLFTVDIGGNQGGTIPQAESCFFLFSSISAGNYLLMDYLIYGYPSDILVLFYDDDSRPIPYTYGFDGEIYYWSLTVPSTTDYVIIEIMNPNSTMSISADRPQIGGGYDSISGGGV